MPLETAERSLRQFASEVMPRFAAPDKTESSSALAAFGVR
jgi:hypothetical protein